MRRGVEDWDVDTVHFLEAEILELVLLTVFQEVELYFPEPLMYRLVVSHNDRLEGSTRGEVNHARTNRRVRVPGKLLRPSELV